MPAYWSRRAALTFTRTHTLPVSRNRRTRTRLLSRLSRPTTLRATVINLPQLRRFALTLAANARIFYPSKVRRWISLIFLR